MMKHFFRFPALVPFLGAILSLAVLPASAQLRATLSQTLNFPNVEITVTLNNTTNTPYFIGESDFAFNTNALALTNASVALVTPGVWHSNPQYDPLDVRNVTVGGNYIVVGIKPTTNITTGIAIAPNSSERVATIRIPISACTLTNTLTWRAQNTIISDVRFNSLISGGADLSVTGGPLTLAPAFTAPTATATVGTPPRPVTGNTINMCVSERFTLSVPTTTGVTAYQFFRNGVALGPAGSATSFTWIPSPTNRAQNGDQVWCTVTTAQCTYRTNQFTLSVQDTLSPPVLLPTPELDSGQCATGLAGTNYTVRILSVPTATSYTFTLTPAGAGTINTVGTAATITWSGAPGLCTLSVAANNLCGVGRVANKVFRIYSGVPVNPPGRLTRARRLDGSQRATSYKINDPENQYFEFNAGNVNNRQYDFEIRPKNSVADTLAPFTQALAIADYPFLQDNTRQRDSLRLKVTWNRYFQDTVAFIRYRARNACGGAPWDSLKVNFTTLVPRPDSVRLVRNSDGTAIDSICQGSVDSTFFRAFFATPLAGSQYSTKKRPYRYFIIRDDRESQRRGIPATSLAPAAAQPLANPARNFQRYFVSDSTGFWAQWNPNYYGAVRVIAAGYTDTANYGGSPTSRLAGQQFAPGADTSGMGDTISFVFYIRPKPLRPTALPVTYFNGRPAPEYRAVNKGVDTEVTFCLTGKVKPVFAKTGIWGVKPVRPDTSFRVDSIGTLTVIPGIDSSAYCIRLALRPNAREGYYRIFMRGVNDCGEGIDGDTSFIFHITNRPVATPGPIILVRGGTIGGFNFCDGTASTQYRLPRGDSSNYTYYEWRLVPETAGTIVYDPARGTEQGAITVNWNRFTGRVWLKAFAVAGPNRNNFTALPFGDSVSIRVLPQPTANAGNGHNMPAHSSAYIGGTGMTARYNRPGVVEPPTYAGAIGRPDSVRLTWTSTPPDAVSRLSNRPGTLIGPDQGRGNNPDYLNPLFTPTIPGTYTFNLTVTDSSGCVSAPSSITFNVTENWNLGVRALLGGAIQTPVVPTSPRMRNDLFRQVGAQSPVGFFDRYEGYNAGMNRGFTVKRIANPFPGGGDSLGPVDVITVGVLTDFNCSTPNTLPELNVVAEGRAWLYPDGSIRDFETATVPYARITGGSGTPPTGMIAFVQHRNHLTLFSNTVANQNVIPATGANAPGGTLTTGTADLTREANVARAGLYVSGVGSEYLVPGGGGATPQTRRVVAIPGKVSQVQNWTINNLDLAKIRQAAATPQTEVYDENDVNLDRSVNAADVAIVDNNVRLFKHNIFRK